MKNNEWEDICTNCGWCCLIKIQDDETEQIYYTDVVCKYFDIDSCKCRVYKERCNLVPECLKLTPNNLDSIPWMPKACAYRKLLGQTPINVPKVNTFCISENMVEEEDLEDHIIDEE